MRQRWDESFYMREHWEGNLKLRQLWVDDDFFLNGTTLGKESKNEKTLAGILHTNTHTKKPLCVEI